MIKPRTNVRIKRQYGARFSLGLMSYLPTFLTILICFQSSLSMGYQIKQDVPAGQDINSAYYKYNLLVHKMLEEKVAPAFSKQAHRLEVDYEFNLDFQGRVTSLKTHAKAGGQEAEQTIARSIRALKFPAVPAQVFIELNQPPPLRIWGTLSWEPPSSASAADESISVAGKQQFEAMLKAEAPYLAKARATYPNAKKRYLAGLPAGYTFAVRRHLTEPGSSEPVRMEGVYVDVDAIKDGKIYGRIGDVNLPSFHRGQRISFPESELEDWVITHPDGNEEGNVVGKFLKSARSAHTNDLALSSDDIANIKQVCHQVIGLPFQGAALWRGLQSFYQPGSDFYQPTTTCAGQYCSGGLRLRDDSEVLYSYLHMDHKSGDLTPDVGRKGNNRIVGVSLIRHGKTIFSDGQLDRNTIDLYLRHRNLKKRK
jgi:hypothetical protein